MKLLELLPKSKKEIFLIGFALMALIVAVVFTLLTSKSEPTINPLPEPIYKNLKSDINKPLNNSLLEGPDLKKTTPLSDNQVEYSFISSLPARDNLIITKGDKVIFERAITNPEANILPKFDSYFQKYGKPEAEVKGSKFYGEFQTTYIYASKGFALIANPFTMEIDEVHTFASMSVDDYIKIWGQDIQSYSGEEGREQ